MVIRCHLLRAGLVHGLAATALAGLLLAVSAAAGTRSPSGWIAFVSNLSPAASKLDGRVGASRVHAFSIDGSPRVDFSTGIGRLSDERASLSPDGRLIAFVRGDPESMSGELWLANADGSNARRLLAPEWLESFALQGFPELHFAAPAWSPDETQLAIDAVSTASCLPSSTKCATWYTVIVDLGGRRLGIAGGLNATWSPNGRYLLLKTGLFSLEDANTWEMAIERADGSQGARWGVNEKRPGACWNGGSWSPDGLRLLLVESNCSDRGIRLHVIRTRDWEEIAVLTGCCASWAPDGSRFAYIARSKKKDVLTTVTRDGKRPTRISSTGLDAAWSPSTDRLAYVRPARGRLEVVTARGDGSDVRHVASGTWRVASVDMWSRNGRRIAFTTGRGRTSTIAVVSSTGGPVRAVHRDVEGARSAVAGWTADDRRLIVVRGVYGLYPYALWVMRPDGSGMRRLTADGTGPLGPAWSPDASKIAFWSDNPSTRTRPETLIVYVMAAAGGAVRRVVGGPRGAYASDPAWAPDGKRLVFVRWTDANHQDLFVVGVDGRGLRRVTSTGHAFAPAWSPDGSTIAFSDDGRLTAVAPSGGKLRRLVDSRLAQYCGGVAWSPDGRRLAAACSSGLVVFEADGGSVRVLDPAGADSAPSWSPGGALIVYGHESELNIVTADGGAPKTIELRGATSRDPDWSR